jgi:hypothetical protein
LKDAEFMVPINSVQMTNCQRKSSFLGQKNSNLQFPGKFVGQLFSRLIKINLLTAGETQKIKSPK